MNSFGPLLRTAREENDWTVEYVSFKSKIQPAIIQALEDDDFEDFKSESYAKSFLKKYSIFLEMDLEDEIRDLHITGFEELDSYNARETVKENLETSQFSKKNRRYRKAERGTGSPVFLIGAVIALISALAAFYYLGSQANNSEITSSEAVDSFASSDRAFRREQAVKERLVSQKQKVKPAKVIRPKSIPYASPRVNQPPSRVGFGPFPELDYISRPDIRALNANPGDRPTAVQPAVRSGIEGLSPLLNEDF